MLFIFTKAFFRKKKPLSSALPAVSAKPLFSGLSLALLVGGTLASTHAAQAQNGHRTARPVMRVPVVTSYWPLAAPAGAVIKVNGKALHAARYVVFNGMKARVTHVNGPGTQLMALVPNGATSGSLRVQTATATLPVGRFRLEHGAARATKTPPRTYTIATASNSIFTPSTWRSN